MRSRRTTVSGPDVSGPTSGWCVGRMCGHCVFITGRVTWGTVHLPTLRVLLSRTPSTTEGYLETGVGEVTSSYERVDKGVIREKFQQNETKNKGQRRTSWTRSGTGIGVVPRGQEEKPLETWWGQSFYFRR